MKKFGYARVSTTDQDLSVQMEALARAGVATTFAEKVTGTTRDGRYELKRVLSVLAMALSLPDSIASAAVCATSPTLPMRSTRLVLT